MAGTPDRSEEQKASGVPAPAEERDPRLAVARETPSSSGVDRATAVFSVRDVAEAGSGSAAADEPGDARLRAAVAAWVSGGPGDADADAGPGRDGADAKGADVEVGGAAGAGGSGAGVKSGGAAGADAGPGEDAGAAAADAEDATADAAKSAGDAESGTDAEAAAEPRTDAASAGEAGSESDAAPTDAEPRSDADATPEPGADAEAATESRTDAASAGEAGSGAKAVAGSEDPSDAEAGAKPEAAPADAEPESDAEAGAESRTDAVSDAEAGSGAKTGAESQAAPSDAEPNADAEPGAGEKAAAEPRTGATSDAESKAAPSDAEANEDAEPGAGAKADAKPDTDAKADPKPVADAKPGPGATSDAKPDPDKTPGATSDAKKPGASGAGPVDQPTAVFKAVAPPVDQPTTMLKSPAGKPEGEAERTSKFVPLKPLDDTAAPATDKPTAEQPAPERTTQQPLPPKPPLDLLAELTNTPPPPETRVRTTVRRVKVWTPLVLLLVIVFAVVQAVRPLPTPTLELTAQETVSFEGGKPNVPWPSQGQAAMDVNGIGTFGTYGDQKPVPIASIAKVMTVYLILRDHPLKTGEKGPKIPVDAAAQKHYETGKAENESVVKVSEGQQISEYEALQAVMLPSANNVAKLLARWDTGKSSEDEFVAKMNKTAKELGMSNTHYTDPSGLDKTTVSTAQDLVKLGRAAMENPVFKEISRQPSYVDLNGDKQNNFFGLVPTVAIGIKTGTTTAAGGNILFAAEKTVDGKKQTIIGAALGQYGKPGVANIDEVTGVVSKLIESGQSALTAKTIVKKGDVVGRVDDGLGGTTPVVATKDVSAVGWSGLTVKLQLDEQKGKTPPHAAKAGTVVGVLSVGDGKNDAVEVPVALQKDLTEPGFGQKIKRVG
ncbi:D-alanyl-D-alanine carboxypeptidase [Streptomyces sp. YJ-C3]